MPTLTLLDTFRVLSSFEPPRQSLAGAPWEEYVDWAIAQGLAPLAAYNLEYRLAGADAPEWARDRLLSVYQGSLNDNVMKLVNFKRAVDELEGRRVILLGGPSFAESLYPHVAFRPVLDIEMLVPAADLDAVTQVLSASEFRPELGQPHPSGAARVLSDGRTQLLLFSTLLGESRKAQEEGLFARALPMRVYGSSFFRLELEDAILAVCLDHARDGFEVPLLSFIDLRELLLGAPSTGGPYSRPCDVDALRARAREWRIERALYASLAIVERLFPEAAQIVSRVRPPLRSATRQLLDRLVVAPVAELGRTRAVKGTDRLRRLLAGGG